MVELVVQLDGEPIRGRDGDAELTQRLDAQTDRLHETVPEGEAAHLLVRCGPELPWEPVAPGRSRLLCVVARAVLRPTQTGRRGRRGRHRQTLGTGGRRRGQHPPVSQRQTRAQ